MPGECHIVEFFVKAITPMKQMMVLYKFISSFTFLHYSAIGPVDHFPRPV